MRKKKKKKYTVKIARKLLEIYLLIGTFTDYGDLVTALQRLHVKLNKHGMVSLASRISSVQSSLLSSEISRALATRRAVLERRYARTHTALPINSTNLGKEVRDYFSYFNFRFNDNLLSRS